MLPFAPDTVLPLAAFACWTPRARGGRSAGNCSPISGADVIKLERPVRATTRGWGPPFTPDGLSAYYLSCNRGSCPVTLTSPVRKGTGSSIECSTRPMC